MELFIPPDVAVLFKITFEVPRTLLLDLKQDRALVASDPNFYLFAYSALGVIEAYVVSLLFVIGLN